jgi:hypothetical protein
MPSSLPLVFGRASRATFVALTIAGVAAAVPAAAQTSEPGGGFTIKQITSYPYPSDLAACRADPTSPGCSTRAAFETCTSPKVLASRRAGSPTTQAMTDRS